MRSVRILGTLLLLASVCLAQVAPAKKSPKSGSTAHPQITERERDQGDMEKKMMVVKPLLIQDAQWQIGKIRFETFRPHQPGQLDMVKAIVIGHIRGNELHPGHPQKEEEKKRDGKELFSHQGSLPGGMDHSPMEFESISHNPGPHAQVGVHIRLYQK